MPSPKPSLEGAIAPMAPPTWIRQWKHQCMLVIATHYQTSIGWKPDREFGPSVQEIESRPPARS